MGAYAIYSNQPFIAKGEIKRKRKRGLLDENMELLKNARVEFDDEHQTLVVVPEDAEKDGSNEN